MEPVPLCKNSKIQVYRPEIDFFIDKIEKKEHFAFARQLHGFWDGIAGAMIGLPGLKKKISHEKNYLRILAKRMCEFKEAKQNLHYLPFMYVDILHMIMNLEQRDDFFFATSDLNVYVDEPTHYVEKDFKNTMDWEAEIIDGRIKPFDSNPKQLRQILMSRFLPKGYIPIDGAVWKNYGINHELPRLMEKIKDHRIVVVAPYIFRDLHERANLSNYHCIPISSQKASDKAFELYEEILKTSEPNTVYFFVAGALGTWLVTKLHKHLKDVFMFDVGRGLHYYYPNTGYAWLRHIKKSGAEAN